MAKKVPEGRRFKPGESGNPNGRPRTSEEVKYIRKITAQSLEEIGDLILSGNKSKLQEIASSQTETAIRVAYAKATLNAMVKGDLTTLEMILNRVVGKVKEKVDVNSDGFKVLITDYTKE